MPPSEFWGADTWSMMDAYDGFAISKGIKKPESPGLTKSEIEELKRWMDEDDDRHR